MATTPSAVADRHLRADIRAMAGYTPGEQHNQATKLNTNECPWPPSPAVSAALATVSNDALRLYPDPMARAVATAAAARYGVDPDQVLVGNGSDDCLTILYRSHLGADDHAACPWPSYGLYQTLASIQGARIERVAYHDTGAAGSWHLPSDGLIKAGARLTLIANPNNPSGTLTPRDELRR
ncbi:MAG: aminotransferase class I/II-fold pyridoxal phosphate-dependent enzyme, partial [Planctomycetota bacterium]